MKNVKMPTSLSYEDFLLEKLQNPKHAAGFIEAILEEKKPESELLRDALRKVIQAYIRKQQPSNSVQLYHEKLDQLLTKSGGEEIYTFIALLDALGMQIAIQTKK